MSLRHEEKQILKRLFEKAADASQGFTGSEASENELIHSLSHLESFILQQHGEALSDKLEIDFLKASGIEDPQSIYALLDDAARRVYGTMRGANSLDTVLRQLQEGGAIVKHVADIFVQTDQGQIEASQSDEPNLFEIKYQPRLAWLVEGLKASGIYFDDLIIRIGETDKNMVRQRPYIVIDIPRLNKQIALCEQVGEITFVSSEILDHSTYSRYSKSQLKSLSVMEAVRMTEPYSKWLANIQLLLQGQEEKAKINITDHDRKKSSKKPPLSEEIIVQASTLWFAEHGKWPKLDSGMITSGPLVGNTWNAIQNAIAKNARGLNTEAQGLVQLLELKGLLVAHNSITKKLSEKLIIEGAKLWFEEHGEWPKLDSGPISSGPLAGSSWNSIQVAIAQNLRGLKTEAQGLIHLLELNGLVVSLHSKTKKLSEELIIEAAKLWFEEHGEWPRDSSGDITSGPLAGNGWYAISVAINQNLRGLDVNAKGITSLLENHGLTISYHSNKKYLNEDTIIAAAKLWYTDHGVWPTQHSGDIITGPLAGDKWNNISAAIHAKVRGYNGEAKGLVHLLELRGLKKPAYGHTHKLSEDVIIEAAWQWFAEHGKWPTRYSGTIIIGSLAGDNWRSIDSSLKKAGRGLTERYAGLADFMVRKNLKKPYRPSVPQQNLDL